MTDSVDPLDRAPEPGDRLAVLPATTPAAAPVPYRPRPSGWARAFRWWLGLSVGTFLGIALCVFIGLGHGDFSPLHIAITEDGADGVTINGLGTAGQALLAVGAGLLALLLLLLVPLLVLLIVGSVAIALICGLGVPLIALAAVLAVATSPTWGVGLLIWLAVRRRDANRLAASATMPA